MKEPIYKQIEKLAKELALENMNKNRKKANLEPLNKIPDLWWDCNKLYWMRLATNKFHSK